MKQARTNLKHTIFEFQDGRNPGKNQNLEPMQGIIEVSLSINTPKFSNKTEGLPHETVHASKSPQKLVGTTKKSGVLPANGHRMKNFFC